MTRFFKAHPDALLIVLATIFLAFLIAYFAWGVQYVITQVNRGLKFTPQAEQAGFNLENAASLDFRGLIK